ncbi:MAG: 30S ribosomal protein S3ae [Euryarchaeota archaeon]|nr:30S ribosomal protein S3ae [Euryarchaeota archaeon]MDE1836797.1 30S ribosomal protein S3ae [Euryarchaeota archaeon]MDE1881114.1 30S ribosomal protein S3ae [Euryarchaeota archaeon]MDE2044781.1 30S ribosomal protein S3ae [Thermoplasmata archaeon]
MSPAEEGGGEKKKTTLARTVKDKWRSKVWFKVRAPGLFQHVELGETLATEPEAIIGRSLETTLSELSGGTDVARAHIKLRFAIEEANAQEHVANARFVGHELTSDYIRRLARRKRSKIDLSITVVSKDGVEITLKPVAVSEHRLQAKLRSRMRMKMRELLTQVASQKVAADLVRDMLDGELGKALSNGLRPLYPLKKIEIRASEVKGPIPEAPPAPAEPTPAQGAPEGPQEVPAPETSPPVAAPPA